MALAGTDEPGREMPVGSAALARVRRLAARPPRRGLSVLTYATAAVVLGGPTLAIAVPWLEASYRALAG